MTHLRWEFGFDGQGFRAKCKSCRRITRDKKDLAHCPSKCEIREQLLKGAATIKRKAKAPKQTGFGF